MSSQRDQFERGFTLVEVTVAMAVLSLISSGLISASLAAVSAATRARRASVATILAVERLEQLRGLEWGHGDAEFASPRSDLFTDLSASPLGASGNGLTISPVNALSSDLAGLVDYLDWAGRWVGNGSVVPADAAFVRRWRVSSLPGSADALVLEVVVAGVVHGWSVGDVVRPDDVRLVSVKTRKAS